MTEKDLLSYIRTNKLDEFGSIILGEDVRNILGLVMPEVGTKRDFDNVVMAELQAIDYCRNVLLGEGKYLTSTKGDYRILLPSENAKQVDSYVSSADKKLKRALKLSRNTPTYSDKQPCNKHVRIEMKRQSIKNQRESARLTA